MIHLNIGSNLDSKFGSRFDNILIAIKLLIEAKIIIKKKDVKLRLKEKRRGFTLFIIFILKMNLYVNLHLNKYYTNIHSFC